MSAPGSASSSTAPATPARISLLVAHRDGIEVHLLSIHEAATIGRETPADIVIEDPGLSRRHAKVTHQGATILLEDLGSTNGTIVRGERVSSAELADGEEARLGGVTLGVRVLDRPGVEARSVFGHDRFVTLLEAEVERARFFRRTASVVMLELAEREAGSIASIVPKLQSLLRPVDRVALFARGTVEAVLPELTAEEAARVSESLAASLSARIAAGVASFPQSGTTADRLLEAARRALAQAHRTKSIELARPAGEGRVVAVGEQGPVAESASMKTLFATAARIARSSIPVLLYGETGSGKEVVARCLHEGSSRAAGPLVSVNCAAIPSQLVESTLFGHEKGAFTGASAQHKGVFEAAHGGTVFLDEIGELPLAVQAALLRVLETKRIVRVGNTKEVSVDARIVAATHRDLEEMIARGSFRSDLYYRLNAMTLALPPLRDRREDIEPLARRFLAEANRANERTVRDFDPDAFGALRAYSWQGNVRELRNAIERAVVITTDDVITLADLPDRVRAAAESGAGAIDDGDGVSAPPALPGGLPPFKEAVRDLERRLLLDALEKAGWSQTGAARLLQMPLRTLIHKMNTYGIVKAYSGGQPGPGGSIAPRTGAAR